MKNLININKNKLIYDDPIEFSDMLKKISHSKKMQSKFAEYSILLNKEISPRMQFKRVQSLIEN